MRLQRSVGKADSGMANIGECLTIAAQIMPGDRDSWYRAWTAFGSRLTEQADAAMPGTGSAHGVHIFARRSISGRRSSSTAMIWTGAELRAAYPASVQAFRTALPLLSHPATVLSGELSGYLFAPSRAAVPRPAILYVGGYDGTAEELYASAAPTLERGYAFAAVDGPGQGAMLYEQRVPMRPDWEHVVPGLVDYGLGRPGQTAVRSPDLPEGLPAVHPGRRRRRPLRGHGTHRVLDRSLRLA